VCSRRQERAAGCCDPRRDEISRSNSVFVLLIRLRCLSRETVVILSSWRRVKVPRRWCHCFGQIDAAGDAARYCASSYLVKVPSFDCSSRCFTVRAIAAGASSGIAKQELALISHKTYVSAPAASFGP
jgi:hypothetical protein